MLDDVPHYFEVDDVVAVNEDVPEPGHSPEGIRELRLNPAGALQEISRNSERLPGLVL